MLFQAISTAGGVETEAVGKFLEDMGLEAPEGKEGKNQRKARRRRRRRGWDNDIETMLHPDIENMADTITFGGKGHHSD